MVKKKKTIPIWYLIVGLIIIGYNQISDFLMSWGFQYDWQVNFVLLVIMFVSAYYFTPYVSTILRGR